MHVETDTPSGIAQALRDLADAVENLPGHDLSEILDAVRSARDNAMNAASAASDAASSLADAESEAQEAETTLDTVISDLESLS